MNTEVDSNGLSTVGIINDADNWTLDSGFYKTPVKYSLETMYGTTLIKTVFKITKNEELKE